MSGGGERIRICIRIEFVSSAMYCGPGHLPLVNHLLDGNALIIYCIYGMRHKPSPGQNAVYSLNRVLT